MHVVRIPGSINRSIKLILIALIVIDLTYLFKASYIVS